MSLEFLKEEGMPSTLKDAFDKDYLLEVFKAKSRGGLNEDVLMNMDRLLDMPVHERNVAFQKILNDYLEDNNQEEQEETEELYF